MCVCINFLHNCWWKNSHHCENISSSQKNIFVHPGREIIQFQAIFRGVCKCVYVSISFTNVDQKIPITVKIFLVAKKIFSCILEEKYFNFRSFSEVFVGVCIYLFTLQLLIKNSHHSENISSGQKKIFVHPRREIFEFQVIFRGV